MSPTLSLNDDAISTMGAPLDFGITLEDPRQRLRFRRYLIAAATTSMFIALLAICRAKGLIESRPFMMASVSSVGAIVVFYAMFRFEWNRKARDPSLTLPMMLWAIATVTYVLHHAGPAAGIFLLMYPVILFFGVFRLRTPAMLALTGMILAAYAPILWKASGVGLHDSPAIHVLQWIVLAAVLTWFSFMGGYVHDMRMRLRESEVDELTGAFTRRRILQVLDHEKTQCDRGAGPLSVCVIDLDLFKHVNDTLGHSAGDRVLQNFVGIVQGELRAIDFVGRFGGEEFLLVLTQTSLEGACECAERVRAQTERKTMQAFGVTSGITVSVGVAQYRPGESPRETIARADAALYRAKRDGRNRVAVE